MMNLISTSPGLVVLSSISTVQIPFILEASNNETKINGDQPTYFLAQHVVGCCRCCVGGLCAITGAICAGLPVILEWRLLLLPVARFNTG
jgi:hypothetical protein